MDFDFTYHSLIYFWNIPPLTLKSIRRDGNLKIWRWQQPIANFPSAPTILGYIYWFCHLISSGPKENLQFYVLMTQNSDESFVKFRWIFNAFAFCYIFENCVVLHAFRCCKQLIIMLHILLSQFCFLPLSVKRMRNETSQQKQAARFEIF